MGSRGDWSEECRRIAVDMESDYDRRCPGDGWNVDVACDFVINRIMRFVVR